MSFLFIVLISVPDNKIMYTVDQTMHMNRCSIHAGARPVEY